MHQMRSQILKCNDYECGTLSEDRPGHQTHRSQKTGKMCPVLPGSCVHCMPGSITFPKTVCSKTRLHTITSESFVPPLLNNLPPYRQNGSTGSPNIVGLVHNLQSNAQPPHARKTMRLGHLPKSRRASAGIDRKSSLWTSMSEKQSHLLNPRFPRQKQVREI